MINLARNGYTHAEIVEQLHAPSLQVDFRYELLDSQNRRKFDLKGVKGGTIDQQAFATIKRTANFDMDDVGEGIDYLSDRIKPYMRIRMKDAKWVEFPLGVFLLSAPNRTDDGTITTRSVDAYDGLIILKEDLIDTRYTIVQGTSYYTAIVDVLSGVGITLYNLEQTDKTLPRSIEFEPGTDKLSIVNELLSQLNYVPLHVDVEGYFTSYTYRSPSERAADYEYVDDSYSVIAPGASEELDLFTVANKYVVVRTNEEQPPLVSSFTNSNPDSPTSTVSRGRTITDYREIDDIADQAALDAYVERIAFANSQVYGKITFSTGLMPFHGYSNVLRLRYSPLRIDGKFLETSWSMQLSHDGMMTHELRQIVNIGGGS